jgi:cell division protein FtsN
MLAAVEVAMSEQTKARFAFDLDDLEKQLRQTAGSQPKAASSDPLADLARIVGQDDPFRSMFAEKRNGAVPPPPVQVAPPVPRRIEPSFREAPTDQGSAGLSGGGVLGAVRADRPLPQQDVLDEFDRLLQGELRGTANPTASAPVVTPPSGEADHVADEVQRSLSREQFNGETVSLNARDLDDLADRIRADENLPEDIGQPMPPVDYPEPPEEAPADLRSLEPQQPRKGLVIAGVLLGVAALGVGAVVGLRSLSGPVMTGGEAPVIKADAGPTKVAPQNPGGVEIPNQNKQIYERTPEPRAGEARVVTREEQPIDVQASARAAARVILPGPGAAVPSGAPVDTAASAQPPAVALPTAPAVAAAPPASAGAAPASAPAQSPAAALGEPRRVRTVAVRPDGTIAPPNGASPAAPAVTASTPALRAPTPRAVTEEVPAAAPAAPPASRPVPPRAQVAAAPAGTPVPAAPSASLAPAPRAADAAPASGGFMVQLGAPGSESEARSTFASLQRRYADQLASANPVIRRADVGNGRTVYRLRVGPFSREEAAEKCQALQAAGGQCFIARN